MRKISILLCALLIGFVCVSWAAESTEQTRQKTILTIATGGEAGVYYPLGVGLANLLTNHLENVEVTAKTSDASAANIKLIADREVALAFVQNDVAFRAVNGERPFREPVRNLSMIAALYPEFVQFVTAHGNGVNYISDLKGRRVSVGSIESGSIDSVAAILSAAGITYADINAVFLDFASTALRIQEGELDAGIVIAGYPAPALTALGARMDINLVVFEEELLGRLSAYPFFTRGVIPAGTYSGIDHDTPTIAVMALLVCDSDLPDELVYSITRVIFENLPELAPAHPKAEMISLDTALTGASIPLHPGAARFFAERGIEVPVF